MNKATKGALAAAAAAAILAGGAGTMAAWTASDSGTNGGTISAGSMTVTERDNTGVWTWANGTHVNDVISDINSIQLVPGQSVKYTATYDVTLAGTNLTATLTPTVGGITGDLGDFLDVANAGDTATTVTTSGAYPVSTTLTFNEEKAGAAGGMDTTASLAGASVSLTQTIS